MDAGNDLADTRLYAGLLAKIGYIFARLANNDAGVLCADERAESESVMGLGRGGAGLGRSACGRVRKIRRGTWGTQRPFSCFGESEDMAARRRNGEDDGEKKKKPGSLITNSAWKISGYVRQLRKSSQFTQNTHM
jgi:hypothetical protein